MKIEKVDKIQINDYLDYTGKEIDGVIKEILDTIELRGDIYYAGHEKKEWIKMTLERFMPNYSNESKIIYPLENDREIARRICIYALEKQKELFNFAHVFLFPCFSDFVNEKMSGVTGYCSRENVLLIFINFNGNWKKGLNSVVLHELAHSVSKFYNGGLVSIGEGMIFDGLAEHYRESVLRDGKSPLVTGLKKEEADKIFEELRDKLNSETLKDYTDVFFGTGKYPTWTGYILGYNLITKFLKEKDNIDWYEILRMDPKIILKKVI